MTARLYYAGGCKKCVFLARLITRFARGTIDAVPMEFDETWTFYTERFPEARGYPVLVMPDGAAVGRGVFSSTIAWVIGSWLRR